MNTITIKVIAWENDGQSLICKYASDETNSSNPDDYPPYAFQPKLMWPHATTADAVLEEAARAGISICETIKAEEDLARDPAEIAVYESLVGTEQTYPADELVIIDSTDNSQANMDYASIVTNLES